MQPGEAYKRPARILPVIILSQFAGTSLWFAGNAILPDIQQQLHLNGNLAGTITSVVQFGFIAGTLVFAFFSIPDRFPSSLVFFVSAIIAALANVAIIWIAKSMSSLFVLRFITGFFLAGIYPVGMKIAADWYERGLGKTLGYLVGALVLGTAFPYLLKSGAFALPAKSVLLFTSAFAVMGGVLILAFVGNGPYRKTGTRFQPMVVYKIFRSADFRAAAFGYFGHMWELYAFWAFASTMIALYSQGTGYSLNPSLCTFIIIAAGSIGCVAGGYISKPMGSSRVAFYSLVCSGVCCICSFLFFHLPLPLFAALLIIWGIAVTADSPQFSTLVAQISLPEYKGTALTIVTCIGFAITIGSIQLLNYFFNTFTKPQYAFMLLAPGPVLGLFFLARLLKKKI